MFVLDKSVACKRENMPGYLLNSKHFTISVQNALRSSEDNIPRNLPQQLFRQLLHAGLLEPSIGHFTNLEVILTQTIFRPSLFQTKTLEASTKTRMQTSWQACWPEKELELYAV